MLLSFPVKADIIAVIFVGCFSKAVGDIALEFALVDYFILTVDRALTMLPFPFELPNIKVPRLHLDYPTIPQPIHQLEIL